VVGPSLWLILIEAVKQQLTAASRKRHLEDVQAVEVTLGQLQLSDCCVVLLVVHAVACHWLATGLGVSESRCYGSGSGSVLIDCWLHIAQSRAAGCRWLRKVAVAAGACAAQLPACCTTICSSDQQPCVAHFLCLYVFLMLRLARPIALALHRTYQSSHL
jgi:hypothetical protein